MDVDTSYLTEELLLATRHYLHGEIDLGALEDAALRHVTILPTLPPAAPAAQLLGAITLSLAELRNGDISEVELRQDLQAELTAITADTRVPTTVPSGLRP